MAYKPKARVTVLVDSSCNMARVKVKVGRSISHELGMEGNFWDFHPGCHGEDRFGDFRGHGSYAHAVKRYLKDQGYDVKFESGTYEFEK